MTKNRYITVTVTLLLVISVLLNMFILQSCKKKSDGNKEQAVETNEIADTIDTSEQETAKDTETEEEKETEPHYDPDPKDTEEEAYIPQNNSIFELNEKGAVIGSPADYDSIVISLGGYSYTAKEYFADNKKAISDWTPAVIKKAVKESRSEFGVSAQYDDNDQLNTLRFSANPDFVSYGSDYGIYTDIAELDFSINGIALGSRVEEMESIFGTNHSIIPYYEGSVRNVYFFENTGSLEFRSLDGVILDIDIYLWA